MALCESPWIPANVEVGMNTTPLKKGSHLIPRRLAFLVERLLTLQVESRTRADQTGPLCWSLCSPRKDHTLSAAACCSPLPNKSMNKKGKVVAVPTQFFPEKQ